MKPIRPGPFNRGPFRGPITENISSTGEVTRPALFVNTPWKRALAVELFPNVAALFVAAAPYIPPAPVDPTFFKRPAVQIEQSPNIACRQQTIRPAGTYIEPTVWRTPPAAPDVYPNLAVRQQTIRPAGTYIDPPLWRTPLNLDVLPNLAVNLQTARPYGTYIDPQGWKARYQFDQAPNLAALAAPPAARIPTPIDPPTAKARAPQPDLAPNLAAQTETVPVERQPLYVTSAWKRGPQPDLVTNVAVRVLAGYVPPPPIDPTFYKRWPLVVDLFPNRAIYAQSETTFVLATDGSTIPGGRWTAPDVLPNIAALAIPPAVLIRPSPEPTLWRWRLNVDVFPNLAVNLQTARPAGAYIEPPTWTPRPQVPEIFPNLAVRFVAPQAPLVTPIDPWINKRYPPQVEVFQNQAVYAPPEAPGPRTDSSIPTRWQSPVQVDLYPNLAVLAPPAPPPPVVVPDQGQGGAGFVPGKPPKKLRRHDPYGLDLVEQMEAKAGPVKRDGQVFGEEFPVAPGIVAYEPSATLRSAVSNALTAAQTVQVQPTPAEREPARSASQKRSRALALLRLFMEI